MSDWSFEELVSNHDLAYQMLTSGLLWGSGDVLAQCIERYYQGNRGISSVSLFDWKLVRTVRLAFFGCFVWAFLTYYWFRFLERILPGQGIVVAIERMLLDQSFYAPMIILLLFVVIGVLEGLTWKSLLVKVRAGFLPTLFSNWMLWPLVQLLLQGGLIPLQHRIIIANLINIPWTAYLAYKAANNNNNNNNNTNNKHLLNLNNPNNNNINSGILKVGTELEEPIPSYAEEEEQVELMQSK